MRRLFFLLLISFIYIKQSNAQDIKYPCSVRIKQVGYFWKIDSIGTNGFRRFTAQKITEAKFDSVSKSFLLENFGQPNQVWNRPLDKAQVLVYHTFDVSKMPPGYEAPLSCSYIGFIYFPNNDYLFSIVEGDIDM